MDFSRRLYRWASEGVDMYVSLTQWQWPWEQGKSCTRSQQWFSGNRSIFEGFHWKSQIFEGFRNPRIGPSYFRGSVRTLQTLIVVIHSASLVLNYMLQFAYSAGWNNNPTAK